MADCVGKSKRVLEESSSTSFTKKRKIDSDIEEFELVNNVVDVHESHSLVTNSPATSSNSGDLCCSGIVPSDIVKDSSTLVDLEGERFETENPTCINNNNISRDITTTPSEICRESSKDMDYQEKKPSTERNHRRDSRAKKSPSQAELDEFFAVAEEQEQKRFIEKYNYDIVKDTPLEGRYQWVRI
ncbi:CDI domain-containing protein [Cephalotus follicularis]|uniref:CDI domain-containing protein n=1 Tax=Cephalotus follicularis TaxID=3775 RepID=A0A1Q3BRE6_CEPFO|nr:CDI domain-containing protein [Cephalotus follicularis]